jgi:poly-gamma-glutamate synthesis protein (capsule biosynthesis protein)
MIVGLIVALGVVAPRQRPAPTDTLRLAAVGDINLGRRVARERLLAGDTLYAFRAVRELLAADITFGNLESPIAPDSAEPSDSGTVFAAPRLAALALARAGFDIVSTANNHAWDAGPAGVTETMRQLTRAGVRFVGSGFGRDMAEQPVILERRGWRVAFFAVTRAWNPAP